MSKVNSNLLVAIVGMCGSGKSVVTSHLKQNGWQVIHFGGVTMQELEKRNLPKNEKNEKMVREELRHIHGPAAFAKLLLPQITEAMKIGPTVLDGLYSWSEYKLLKDAFSDRMSVIAVVATRILRYHRLTTRTVRPLTHEEASQRDFSEIENLEKGGPIAMADYFILNDKAEQDLVQSLEQIISLIRQK